MRRSTREDSLRMLDAAAGSGIIDPREIALAREIMDEVEGEQGALGYPEIGMDPHLCRIKLCWEEGPSNAVEVSFAEQGWGVSPALVLRQYTHAGMNKVVRNLHDLRNFVRKVRDALSNVEAKIHRG